MEEHDQWTERDVALDRYRRHHEYMAELFLPILLIEAPTSVYTLSTEAKENLVKELDQSQEKVVTTKNQHQDLKERVRNDSQQFQSALTTIATTQTIAELQQQQQQLIEANLIVVDDSNKETVVPVGMPRPPAIQVKKTAIPQEEPFPHSERLITL
ncbi:hypothetical protein BDF19DRAFT_446857 [Syncephalis fuscata]|nr:hypothetical protein BDF19DRAFT_446857 [Syncephalis fuscata]